MQKVKLLMIQAAGEMMNQDETAWLRKIILLSIAIGWGE
jgi:hypothetical protein